jgi:hypothetical protein
MPAKCCNLIPLHLAVKYLSKEEATQYRLGFEEWNTNAKDRIYCPNLRCSEFIPKRYVDKETIIDDLKTFQCPKTGCGTQICRDCKSYTHVGLPCSQDKEQDAAIAQVMQWGYKQCPRCGHGIRKMYGCSHMVCLCGAHFCWVCNKGINECEMDGGCIDDDGSGYDNSDSEAGDESQLGAALETAQVDQPCETTQDTPPVMTPLEHEPRDNSQNPGTIDTQVYVSLLEADRVDEQGVTIAPPVVIPEPRQRVRTAQPQNLDHAEGPRFWEEQDLDFGEEPQGSDTTLWGCHHHWNEVDAKQLSLCFWDRGAMSKGKAREEVEPECHSCWAVVKASGWECSQCAVVFCEECKKENTGDEAG